MRALLLVLLAGCAGPAATPAAVELPPPPPPRPARAAWALTWHGAPIGGAWERDDGARFERHEQIVVRRGDDVVISELAITIDRDDRGETATIEVSRWQDGPVLAGVARALPGGGWLVEVEGEPRLALPPAVPFELAIRDRHFRGPVVLAGWGFAVADLTVEPSAGGHRARLQVAGRRLEARLRYDDDGTIAELAGNDGVVARRAGADDDLRPAAPPEVVEANAIAVTGAPSATIALPDATAPPPPPLPGQRVAAWTISLDANAPGGLAAAPATADRSADIAGLVHRVATEVSDDLSATAATTAAARTATRGDCTTHALRFAALAADAGIATHVVTGLRLDQQALVRHRWNLAWTGTRWIAVDATWDEAPASPSLIGLAVHGPRAADLAAADATVFDGLGTRAVTR